MGVELKGFFEKKTPEGWEFVPDNYSDFRSNQLNWWLGAFCRDGSVTPIIVKPRGLPKKVNKHDAECYCGETQPSWLFSDEILSAPLPSEPSPQLLEFVSEVKRLNLLYGQVRYTYGFDC